MIYLAQTLYKLTATEVKMPVKAPKETAGNMELRNEL